MRSFDSMRAVLAAIGLTLLIGHPAKAANCEWTGFSNAGEVRMRLTDFAADTCLLAPLCDTPLCNQVAALRDPSEEEVVHMLEVIRDSLLKQLPQGYPGVGEMRARIEGWIPIVRQTRPDRLPTGLWQVQGRSVFAREPDEVRFGSAIESRMESLHTTLQAEFALAATQMRMALLVDRTLRALMASTRTAYVHYLESLDRRWQSYVGDSRSSYPWEWFVNDRLLGRHQSRDGFEEPRTRQILFLHPDAAYQYATLGGDRLSESVTLEVLGLARYKWGTDDKLKTRLSGSAFVGWRGNTKETPFWGLMAHLAHGGSVGVGVRSRQQKAEWGVFASGDVGKLFLANGDARAAIVRAELLKRVSPQP